MFSHAKSQRTRWFRLILGVLAAAAIALLIPVTALAAEVHSGDTVTIGPNQVVTDDLYVFGSNVIVEGTIQGDLIAAGSTVTIAGHVTGSVIAAGSTVSVGGPVDGSVRVAGNLVTLAAPVGGDALLAGSSVTLNGPAHVGRDALLAGAAMNLEAPVARNVTAAGNKLIIGSTVGGAVNANVTDLVLGDGALVSGPVSYISSHDASVAPTASVGGAMQRTPAPVTANPWQVGGIDTLALLRGFVGLAVLGLLLVFAFPRAAASASATLERQWPTSLGLGLVVLLGTPIIAVAIFVVGLLIGGWWIGLMLLGAYSTVGVVGYLACAEWVGMTAMRMAKSAANPIWAVLLGLLILALLSLIPVLGGLIVLAAVVFGVGAVALSAWQAYRPTPRAESLPIAAQARTQLQAAA